MQLIINFFASCRQQLIRQVEAIGGHLINAVIFLNVYGRINPLIVQCYPSAKLHAWEMRFLFQIEQAFHRNIKYIRKVIKFEEKLGEDNFLKLPKFNETVIEYMLLFFYLSLKCLEEDNNLNAIQKIRLAWFLEAWMTYHATRKIRGHLRDKLESTTNPRISKRKQSKLDIQRIRQYLEDLYIKRITTIFKNINSESREEYIEYDLKLTFIKPLPNNIDESRQIVNRSKWLEEVYSDLIDSYPMQYALIKVKLYLRLF